jgi:hypothetical protein
VTLPKATQELTRTDAIRRWAICPVHGQRSSAYQGVEDTGWRFSCQATAHHTKHFFYAAPDRTAPRTAEEVGEWMERMRARRVSVRG